MDQPPCVSWPDWHCPTHMKPVSLEGEALVCPHGDRFPIERGIPRFAGSSDYVDTFGAQWNRYVKTQLDSYTGTTISAARTKESLGEPLWNDLAGKHIAELGCGAGRFTEILLERGGCVTSIDLSTAVDANAANFPISDRHRVAQADILRLPFAGESFDVVFCLGVIFCTPSPEETIAALAKHVKPGGHIVIDLAKFSWSWATRSAALARRVLRHVDAARGVRITERLVEIFLPLHKRVVNNRPARIALKRISPITTFYESFPELNEDLQREWAMLDTHDTLTAYYRHYHTPEQVTEVLRDRGFVEIESFAGGLGVVARGRMPEATTG